MKGLNFMEAVKTNKLCQTTNNMYRVIYIPSIMSVELQIKTIDGYLVIPFDNSYLSYFVGTDWEIVDSDKDWNLASGYFNSFQVPSEIKNNVKKCRDLILKDFDNLKEGDCIFSIVNKRFGVMDNDHASLGDL